MAVLHSLSEHGAEHGHLWHELLNLLLDHFGHGDDLDLVFITERFETLVDEALSFGNGLFQDSRIDGKEVVVEPRLHVVLPVLDRRPQLVVGQELIAHFLDVFIGCLVVVGERLVFVVLLGLSGGSVEPVLQGTSLLRHFFKVFELRVLLECINLNLNCVSLRSEFILVLLHNVHEFVLFLVKVVLLLGDLFEGVARGTE